MSKNDILASNLIEKTLFFCVISLSKSKSINISLTAFCVSTLLEVISTALIEPIPKGELLLLNSPLSSAYYSQERQYVLDKRGEKVG